MYNVHMTSLRFEWEPRKASANLKKHGISFEEAKSVFYDEGAKLISDPDHSEDEDRFILLGVEEPVGIFRISRGGLNTTFHVVGCDTLTYGVAFRIEVY